MCERGSQILAFGRKWLEQIRSAIKAAGHLTKSTNGLYLLLRQCSCKFKCSPRLKIVIILTLSGLKGYTQMLSDKYVFVCILLT